MTNLTSSDLIAKYRSEFKKLRPVFSPAINESIYFNMRGLKHLIFKNKHRRGSKVIFNRLVLIPLIVPVIRNCVEESEIRIRREKIRGKKVRVTYFALEAHVGRSNVLVRVVTRKEGESGKHYFQSIMKY